jgi:hypothetical protein
MIVLSTIKFRRTRQKKGFILAGVLVLVLLASMIVMSLLFRMHAEEAAMAAQRGSEAANLAAMSGIEQALKVAAGVTPGSLDWRDNPRAFKDHFVYEDGSERWYFTVYSKADEDSLEPLRYGLTDEASKIHLNIAERDVLGRIPGMDAELLKALDGQPASESSLNDPFAGSADSAFEEFFAPLTTSMPRSYQSFTELLTLPGFTPALVFGEDANFNLKLDPNEDDAGERPPADNSDGRLDLGFSQYLTLFATEPNVDNKNVPRTDINVANDPFPLVELPGSLTNYILALRTNKIKVNHASELLEAKIKVKDAKGVEVELASEVSKTELAQVLDLFTGKADKKTDGLVNVNTAPLKVLAALPGLDDPLAESIVSTRKSISPERRSTIAWLFQEGTLTADQFKKVAPSLTARSFQYSFHVVGYGLPSGRYKVFEAVIDSQGRGTVLSLRDLTRYGLPIPLTEPAQSEPAKVGMKRNFRDSNVPEGRLHG